MMRRAELGIHTNSAFARLLTDSIMVKIETAAEPGSHRWRIAARHAALVAYHKLRERLPDQSFSFFYAPSHPNYRASDEAGAEAAATIDNGPEPIPNESDSAVQVASEPETAIQRAA